MVLRFLILVLFFIFACADYERDNIFDTEGANSQYAPCGSGSAKFSKETERCKNNIIETKCGSGWYNAANGDLRCREDVIEAKCDWNSWNGSYNWYNIANENLRCRDGLLIETKCGSDWYNAEDVYLRCQSDLVETRCGSDWYNAMNYSLRCQSGLIETQCGNDWYNAANADLRCQSDLVETKCGSDWYNAANADLRCQSDLVETKCGNDWYNAANADLRCQSDLVEAKCGNNWYDVNADLRCQGGLIETKCGNGWFNAATSFCYNNRVTAKCGERPEIFDDSLYECREGNKIYLKAPVSHGNQSYDAVLIDDFTWMADNLNYAGTEGDLGACYDNDEDNCVAYGRLYNWESALTVCPSGWHLPSREEWSTLNNEADAYGFSAVLGGFGFNDNFYEIDSQGMWWSATSESTDDAYSWFYGGIGISDKALLLSVRCVKDY